MVHDTTYGAVAGVILAAGHGTRMRPLSESIPKPLLPVLGVPLFEIITERLLRSGAERIHANIFHLADRIDDFARGRNWPLTFHREPELLGTGGGIGNMAADLSESDLIMLQNGDILSSIDFGPAISLHRDRGALVTMVVIPGVGKSNSGGEGATSGEATHPAGHRPPASVHVDAGGVVTAIATDRENPLGTAVLGYTGMAVLSPAALTHFPHGEPGGLVETILAIIAREPGSVIAYNAATRDDTVRWGEIGSCRGYIDIHERIMIGKTAFDPLLPPPPLSIHVGEKTTIDAGAEWHGFLEVGSRVMIERDVVLEDCVVLDGTVVEAGGRFRRAVLYPGGVIEA
jgi:mannose-1-phosphate guanylyltransferase